ncbi:MAG: ComF family protein [Terracidiphilus sp.]
MRYTCRIGLHRFGFCPEARCVFSRDTAIRTADVPLAQTTRWRAVVRVLRSPIDSLSCALLPSSCALCGSPLPELSSVPICPVCWSEFPVQSGSVCARCGDAITAPATPTVSMLCRTCRLAPPPFVRAVSHGVYEGRMREAIHALKYDRLHSAARELGRLLAGAIAQLAGEAPVEMLVIPVPLHRSKYAQRGFNQSRSLAVEALKFLHASHPQWQLALAPSTLMRLRATGSQAGLAPRERRINVRGAFSVSDPSKVTAQHILLVDDILTTGATARAAAQTLLKAGAASVWVATLARAQRSTGFGRPINSARDQERDDDSEVDGEILTGSAMQVDPNAASADSSTLRKQPSS